MENQQNEEIEIDLLELFHVLKGRLMEMIAAAVAAAMLFGFGTVFLIRPVYESTSRLYIVGQSSGLASLTDLQMGSQLAQDYMVLVESRPVLEQVIDNLGLDLEYEELLNQITLNNPADTHILDITVRTDDPYIAKEIVDEIGRVACERIVAVMNVNEPTIVENGHLERSPSSPNVLKNTLIGALAGLLLSMAAVVVCYLLDDKVATEEDVEKYLGLNTLAVIPVEEGSGRQVLMDRKKRGRWKFGNGNI